MCPDDVAAGTEVPIAVFVAELRVAGERLNFTTLFVWIVSKPVPFIVTVVAATPDVGVKLVMVGLPLPLVSVKVCELVAVPEGAVTVSVPVVAPFGTVVISCVELADVMVAAAPLKETAS